MNRLVLTLALTGLLGAGCASSYYQQYRSENPGWVPVFPDEQASLEETLASIHTPPLLPNNQITIRRLDILRTEVDPWQPVDFDDVRSGAFRSSGQQSYLVVAEFLCSARVDTQSYRGAKVAWYLLEGNQLSAWNHYDFSEGCTMFNDFRPATAALVEVERAATGYVDANFPASQVHVAQLYMQGLAYAKVGRLDDARRMLSLGDSGFDVASRGARESPEFEAEGRRARISDAAHAAAARADLVRAIEVREAR